MARCEAVLWRGAFICKHSVYKHEAVAKNTGASFYYKLIQGSYSTLIKQSVGTHALGGVTDHELDGTSWVTAVMTDRVIRATMLLDWIRWWTGNHHGHVLDPECPNLSPEAIAQFIEFGKGGDGLVGDAKDPGDRTNAAKIVALFNQRRSNPARVRLIQRGLGLTVDGVWGTQTDAAISKVRAAKTVGVKAVQTGLLVNADGDWGSVTDQAYVSLRAAVYKPSVSVTPAPPAPTTTPTTEETDMQLTDKIALRTDGTVKYTSETTDVAGILASTNYYLLEMKQEAARRDADQLAQITALTAAVKSLSENNGVDPTLVASIVESAVRSSLDNLRIVDVDPT